VLYPVQSPRRGRLYLRVSPDQTEEVWTGTSHTVIAPDATPVVRIALASLCSQAESLVQSILLAYSPDTSHTLLIEPVYSLSLPCTEFFQQLPEEARDLPNSLPITRPMRLFRVSTLSHTSLLS
jgi:hypothetical protein